MATIYIPIFVQGVMGGSATNSGLILTPMMLGSVVGSMAGGIMSTRTAFRNIMLVSGLFFAAGIFLLSTLTADTARSILTLYMIVTGFGVGFSFSVLSMAAIHNFDIRQRGSATSTNSFMRSLGMTVGITVFGIIQRNQFTGKLGEAFGGTGGMPGAAPGEGFGDPREMLKPETRALIPEPVLEKVAGALSLSIANTFLWTLIPTGLAIVFIVLMSKEQVEVSKAVTQPEA